MGAAALSALRAKCPDCRTLTAVAIGPDYQCHACGREFAAGLLRVPRAWDGGGEGAAAAAGMAVPWPEAATVEEGSLQAQHDAIARELPVRPLVLGGCACAHVGAVRELARRHGPVGVLWIAGGAGPLQAASDPSQALYVALDGEPDDPAALEALFASLPRPVGAGFTGLRATPANEQAVARLGHALGL